MRVRDLWYDRSRRKTSRHPDRGGNPKAKRWLALWTGTDGHEHSKAFAKQSDAVKYATAMEADALRCIRYADPRRGAITVREYGDTKYLPSLLHLRPNSADTYASHLRTHVYPALGSRRIGTVTRTDVQSFVTALSAKLAPSTTETNCWRCSASMPASTLARSCSSGTGPAASRQVHATAGVGTRYRRCRGTSGRWPSKAAIMPQRSTSRASRSSAAPAGSSAPAVTARQGHALDPAL